MTSVNTRRWRPSLVSTRTSQYGDVQPNDSEIWSIFGIEHINPYVFHIQIDSYLQMFKIFILTIFLVPIRLVLSVFFILLAWFFANIGLLGLTLEDLNRQPLNGWRRLIQRIVSICMRLMYACGSFHHIKVIGKRADAKEAPILVVAPHSSYLDSMIAVIMRPTIVAKKESADLPIVGKILSLAQPIYVNRNDSNSRHNTIREITRRAQSPENWPQVVIFPEGTCTNRKALIRFKPGAFYPAMPIQPVIMRYPNRYDTFTWTWIGPPVKVLVWLTLAQIYSCCEIEFLPVYVPSAEEKKNPYLFADNVRQLMSSCLGLPTSEYTYEDAILMTRARELSVPHFSDMIDLELTLRELGLSKLDRLSVLMRSYCITRKEQMNISEFSKFVGISAYDPYVYNLFCLMDRESQEAIVMKDFFLCALFCQLETGSNMDYLKSIRGLYTNNTQLPVYEFQQIMMHCTRLSKQNIRRLFKDVLSNKALDANTITLEEFEEYIANNPVYKFLWQKHPLMALEARMRKK